MPRRRANTSGVDQSPRHVVTHQRVTELISDTITQNMSRIHKRLINSKLITLTYKQKRTKHQENMHTLKYTTHKTAE